MRSLLAAGLALLLASPAWAAPAHWVVDRSASRIGFGGAMSGQPFAGTFGRWNADIAFDPADLAGSKVTAVIDTGSARTGDQTRDEALPTEDWFSAKVFPRATFTTRRITAAGPGRYLAQGDLTIRNVTRPVVLPFTLAIQGDTARMQGYAPLDRSVFGVGLGQFKTGDTVALKVQVNIAVTARRAR